MDEQRDPEARVRRDRASALRELSDRHAAVLWRFARSLTGSDADADDVVQEALLRAWRTPRIIDDDPDAVRGWLFTVARNLVIDRSRSAQRRHERTGVEPERIVDDRTDRLFDSILLHDALDSLSETHREVIVRAYYEGLSTAELSERIGIAEGTVKSRLHYALRALRLAFQERGVTR